MKKQDGSLFKIGEVTKIMGITRKTLLVYESAQLLTPAVKDEESGYRYYTADNMTQIRAIRVLQALGLSLKEIKAYYDDVENIDLFLQRLMELRSALDRNILMLQTRSAREGDLTVHKTILPRQVCFCRDYICQSVADAANRLRETYIAAARTGKMSAYTHMFCVHNSPEADELDLGCCIPVDSSYDGPERRDFPETAALCIYYRGSYESKTAAVQALLAYVKTHAIETTGPFRSIYLEGPPNRQGHPGDYITQVAVPIQG